MNPETKKKIKGWFYKSEQDYFTSYTTLWIGFNAYYKCYYQRNNMASEPFTNRRGIERIKESNAHYELLRKLVKGNDNIRKNLDLLADELRNHPLRNMSNGRQIWFPEGTLSDTGISEDSYKKLIEMFYTIRNNLFHGDKETISERDQTIVELAYKLLHEFMGAIVDGDFVLTEVK